MQSIEIKRVSNTLLAWLDDPFSVPKDQPHCSFCNTPKVERNKKCEICGELAAYTGPRKTRSCNVFVEIYKSEKTIKVRRRN